MYRKRHACHHGGNNIKVIARIIFTFTALPLGPSGRTGRLLHRSLQRADSGGPADGAVFSGLFNLDVAGLDVLMVHGCGGRPEVHVVQVVEVGRLGTVGLVTVGGGRLDDRTAACHCAGAREHGGGRARGHGEVTVGRGTDRRTVADGRRVTSDSAVRI